MLINFVFQASISEVCNKTTWIKKGCRKDLAREMVLLFSDRNPGSEIRIDWSHWSRYLARLACRCATEARRQNLQWFALQYYGECWSRNGSLSLLLPNYPIDYKCNCVGETFKSCHEEDTKSACVGRAFRAYFYQFTDRQHNKSQYQIPAPKRYGCQKAADIAVVIDVSGSVTQANFNKVIQFLKLFVDRFDFPDSATRFALIRYDHSVFIDLTLEDSVLYSLPGLKNKIDELKYTGGSTLTDVALKEVRGKIFNGAPRHGVARTCIVITDGKSHGGAEKVRQPSNDLRSLGVHLIAIGVGDYVDTRELGFIVGDQPQNVLLMTSFDEVLAKAKGTIDQRVLKACRQRGKKPRS